MGEHLYRTGGFGGWVLFCSFILCVFLWWGLHMCASFVSSGLMWTEQAGKENKMCGLGSSSKLDLRWMGWSPVETVGRGGLWDAHPSPSWEVGDKVNRADQSKLGHWAWGLGQICRLGWVQHGEWIRQTRWAGPWCRAGLAWRLDVTQERWRQEHQFTKERSHAQASTGALWWTLGHFFSLK